jgi:protoporphyrinogen oxidase/SAM-dependent methyltransferase
MTAYLLAKKAGDQLSTTVYEATERIGGKIITRRFSSAPVRYEAGAAELYCYSRLGPDPLHQLVKQLGLNTTELVGRTVVLGDRITRNPADIKRHFGKRTARATEKFYLDGTTFVRPKEYYDAGWPEDNDHVLAHRTFESLLTGVKDEAARRYIEVAIHSDLAVEPHQASALFGVQNALIDDRRYVSLYSIDGGLERLPQALRENASAEFQLESAVTRVEKTPTGKYRVYSQRGRQVHYEDHDLVIVALPVSLLPMIEWGGRRLSSAMYAHHAYYHHLAHYLRITILFESPFWRHLISDSYFQLDAFGGCCVYDEGAKQGAEPFGVLSWLLAGTGALVNSNLDDKELVRKALDTLPAALKAGSELMLEGRVDRWAGAVTAHAVGQLIKGPKARHLPEPKEHPGLIVVGDYLFDTTINGVLDSAEIATDLVFSRLRRSQPRSAVAPLIANARTTKPLGLTKSYFKYYDGKRDYNRSFDVYFDAKYIATLIWLAWGKRPPYRLLDAGSASGLTIDAFAQEDIYAWGIENNQYIHKKTPKHLRRKNLLADVCDIPFVDDYFDFAYETCLCYVPEISIDKAISELCRVTKHGVIFGSVTTDILESAFKIKKDALAGVMTSRSTQEWSELFLHNGFRCAVDDPEILKQVWKVERKADDGKPWYPTKESIKYCFYTRQAKQKKSAPAPRQVRQSALVG